MLTRSKLCTLRYTRHSKRRKKYLLATIQKGLCKEPFIRPAHILAESDFENLKQSDIMI